MVVGKALYEVAKIIIKKHGGNILRAETNFITRFPPAHRKTASTILQGAQVATYGGIVSDVLKVLMQAPDSPGNGVPQAYSPKSKTYQSNKARFRSAVRNRSRYSGKYRSGRNNRHPYSCCCGKC